MVVQTKQITDEQKKNTLILYAQELGCKPVYSEEYDGMVIQVNSKKEGKLIKEKIKYLEQN